MAGEPAGDDGEGRCAFCGTPATATRYLFAGRDGVFICAACVLRCSQIMAEEPPPFPRGKPTPPRPWWRRKGQ